MFEADIYSISYPKDGQWHYLPKPWVGPIRQPEEKSNVYAERFNRAAKDFLEMEPTVIVFTEWNDVSNPYK